MKIAVEDPCAANDGPPEAAVKKSIVSSSRVGHCCESAALRCIALVKGL